MIRKYITFDKSAINDNLKEVNFQPNIYVNILRTKEIDEDQMIIIPYIKQTSKTKISYVEIRNTSSTIDDSQSIMDEVQQFKYKLIQSKKSQNEMINMLITNNSEHMGSILGYQSEHSKILNI